MAQPSETQAEASPPEGWRSLLPSLAVALSMGAVFIAFLGVLLSAAGAIGLTPAETNAWILAAYGIPGAIGFFLTWRYRIPMLMTGNAFILVFIARLGTDFSWPELVGASMLAGLAVLVMVPFGLTRLVSKVLPPPIVFGLLAGAVVPFLVDMFSAMSDSILIVGGTIAVYLLAKALWEPRVPAILPALITSVLIAAVTGRVEVGTVDTAPLLPMLTSPEFTFASALTVAPVMLVLITVQANIPSIVFLRDQGYEPPDRLVTLLSGAGTIGGSLLGAVGFSLSLPATAYSAGPDAGPPATRYRAVLLSSVILFAIGALAGFASVISDILPAAVLTVIAGLALLGVTADALHKVTSGPLIWGPLFAFAITLSDLTLLGFGPFFWAIVGGVSIARLVERQAWHELHAAETNSEA